MSTRVKEGNPVRPHICIGYSTERPQDGGGSVQEELDEIEALSQRADDLAKDIEEKDAVRDSVKKYYKLSV